MQHAVRTELFLGQLLQAHSDSPVLVVFINSQIGQVAGVVKIRHRSSDANELVSVPRGHHEVTVFQHAPNAIGIIHRSSRTERTPIE